MRRRTWVLFAVASSAIAVGGCGSSGGASGPREGDGGASALGDAAASTGPGDAAASPPADGSAATIVEAAAPSTAEAGPAPAPVCPSAVALADTSHPTTVVGEGSAGGCTEAALRSAVTQGGVVTFDCGGPTTISIASEIAVPTDRDTVIDGGGTVTLDGGGSTRLLHYASGDYRGMYGGAQHTLTVQRITLTRAKSTGTMMFPAASPPCSQGYQDGAGGAILMTSGTLHVIDATFTNDQAEDIGPDVAGGAIYTTGSVDTTIVG